MATVALSFPRYRRASVAKVRTKRRAFPIENTLMWILCFAAYIALAVYVVFRLHYYINDGITRVDNAFDVLYSRDPHLGAIGFFWGPLPSFLDLPILAFKNLWPPLASQAFAGSIEAAAFSAGSMVLINVGMRWAGVVRGLRWVLCAFWAVNPMVLIFGVQGMAEAPFIFFFLASMIVFLRWSESQRGSLLTLMGIMAGCAALCRNEALVLAFFLGVGVIVQSFRNERNWRRVETEALMYGLPCILFIGLWVVTAAILLHNPLYILHANNVIASGASGAVPAPVTAPAPRTPGAQSPETIIAQYVGSQVIGIATWVQALGYVGGHAVLLFPAIVAMLAVLVVQLVVQRRRVAGAVVLACGLSTLLVDAYVLHTRGLANFFRYQIVVIPFAYIIAMFVLRSLRGRRALLSSLVALAIGGLFGASNVLTADTLSNPGLGLEEASVMNSIGTGHPLPSIGGDYGDLATTPIQLQQILRMDSDHGTILCDSSSCFTWNLMAPNPKLFVVSSDRDWYAALHQPLVYHVEYFLVPDRAVLPNDALNTLYPSLWQDGAGFSVLVGQTSQPAGCRGVPDWWPECASWRLYRIIGPTPLG